MDTRAARRSYAEQIVSDADASDARLIEAFAAVPREDFVGPPPWRLFGEPGDLPLLTDDPRDLYRDALVSLAGERGINNGQPSLHALCMAAAAPVAGQRVIHVGAGTGYYSAILARLVAPGGRVTAYEIESDLAARARLSLAAHAGVRVVAASAVGIAFEPVDLIYVSAGVSHLPHEWLEALAPGGRLLVPLTPDVGSGLMLLVTRNAPGAAVYAARALTGVAFIPCVGARDETSTLVLADALRRGRLSDVRSLRTGDAPDRSAWCVGRGWWLSSDPA